MKNETLLKVTIIYSQEDIEGQVSGKVEIEVEREILSFSITLT